MFPRIFDRYLGRQVGTATLIGVVLLSGLMVLGNVYKMLDELLGNSELPASLVLEFVAMVIPFSLTFTIPWAFLTGILLTFGRLSADNELVSLRMTGMSMPRICLPVFILGVLLSGVCLWVNVDLAPAAKNRMKRLFYRVVVENPETLFQEGQVLDKMPGMRIYTGKRDGKEMTDLHIMMLNGPTDSSYIRADSATLYSEKDSPDIMLNLHGTNLEQATAGDASKSNANAFGESWMNFSLAKLKEDKVRVNASMKTTSALLEEVKTWKDPQGTTLTAIERSLSYTELSKRFSFSLASITFALVAIPLGVTAQRRETTMGFVIGLGVALVYMTFIIMGDALNDKPGAMPHLIMWAPNVLFLGLGAWLFRRLSRR